MVKIKKYDNFQGFQPGGIYQAAEGRSLMYWWGEGYPTEADWHGWISIAKEQRVADSLDGIKAGAVIEETTKELLRWSVERQEYLPEKKKAWKVRALNDIALKALVQGFVRRRDPKSGDGKSARNGEAIPIPAWVKKALWGWVGETTETLPSGNARPVKRPR